MQEQTRGLLERIRRFAMPEGEFKCGGVRLRQEGEMRLAPDRPWLPFWAEQWFACANVDFQWRAWMRMKPFMSVRVVDSFQNGRGTLIVSAFGLVRIVRSQGARDRQGRGSTRPCRVSMAPIRVSRGGIFDLGSRGRRQTSRKIRRWQDPSDWRVPDRPRGEGAGRHNRPSTHRRKIGRRNEMVGDVQRVPGSRPRPPREDSNLSRGRLAHAQRVVHVLSRARHRILGSAVPLSGRKAAKGIVLAATANGENGGRNVTDGLAKNAPALQ